MRYHSDAFVPSLFTRPVVGEVWLRSTENTFWHNQCQISDQTLSYVGIYVYITRACWLVSVPDNAEIEMVPSAC